MSTITELVLGSGNPGEYDSNGSDFDLLRDAVVTAGLADALNATVDGDGNPVNLTVFAPNDDAFIGLAGALGYGGTDEPGSITYILDALSLLGGGDAVPLLTTVLTYHVAPAELFKQDVLDAGDGFMVPTLEGGMLEVDLEGGASLIDATGSERNLIGFDLDADNGVIHVLDSVLLPQAVVDGLALLSKPNTDFIIGDDGSEFYNTGRGNDFVDGNGGWDLIFAGSGKDVVLGGDNGDRLFGGNGKDIVRGEDGWDKVYGGRGNDIVDGGSGVDWLSGGRGRDTFVFENGDDRNYVKDFRNGRDKIDLSGYEGIDGFDDIAHDIKSGFFSTRIDLDDGDVMVLLGVRKHELDSSDFIFAEDAIA